MPLFRDERCYGAAGGSASNNDGVVGVVCVHLPMCFYMRIVRLSFNTWIIEHYCQIPIRGIVSDYVSLESDTIYYPTGQPLHLFPS